MLLPELQTAELWKPSKQGMPFQNWEVWLHFTGLKAANCPVNEWYTAYKHDGK